jgi:YD repeat-containing protein
MTKKLWSGVVAVFLLVGVALSWAVVLPQPTSWTMYGVGPQYSLNNYEWSTSQSASADSYFANFVINNATKGCYRYFWGNDRTGPYTDKSWYDNSWHDCQWNYSTYTYTNSEVSIAPPINCTANGSTRCLLLGMAANRKNIGCPTCNGGEAVVSSSVGLGAHGAAEGGAQGSPAAASLSPTGSIDVGTGNKYQADVDFEVPGSPWFTFIRSYNSSTPAAPSVGIGAQWRHSLTYKLVKNSGGAIDIYRPDGTIKRLGGSNQDVDEPGVLDYVMDGQGNQTGWSFDTTTGQVETYDMRGRIKQIAFKTGGGITYTYPTATTDVPSAVTDHFGRTVSFTYDTSNRITKVTTPGGADYTYAYTNGLLWTVTKPGGGVRKYAYDETSYDSTTSLNGQLTGIYDETNTRFATFRYDKYNRATSSERAGGVDKFTVSYANDGVTNTVGTPLAATRQYTFANLLSVFRSTASTTSCTDGSCGQGGGSTYDTNGNRTSFIGDNGAKTCYAYDTSRNLMTRSVEGLTSNADCTTALTTPPAGSRTTTIAWNPSFKKPDAIATPLKVTSFTYDTMQRPLTVTETPTGDDTGGTGLGAAATGPVRSVAYAYSSSGLLLSVTGPRAGQVTAYEYDTAGNMTKSTNAVGQVTTYGSFTGDGRPQSMTLPSGASVTLGYDSLGHLTSVVQEGENTTLTYNGMHLLTNVTLPNGESLTYGYDTAERLTSITDGRGQKVTYGLNAAGLPTSQQVLYANNSVALTVTRVFDMLGHLKQVTGAQRM